MMTVLLSTVGVGILLIIVSMIQNIVTGIRSTILKSLFFR